MLVTFRTKAYADITMFGDVAVALLKLAGLSGNVPTAILAADIPAALDRLRAGLAEHGRDVPRSGAGRSAGEADGAADGGGEDAEPRVPLGKRAFPLLELLRAAHAAGADVLVQ